MNKLLVTAAIVALMTTSATAQSFQQQIDATMETLIVRNLMDNYGGVCETHEFYPMTDVAYNHLQSVFATPDLEYAASRRAHELMQDCAQVFAFMNQTYVLQQMEGEAAIINHPVIQAQQAKDAALMERVYSDINAYLDRTAQ